MRRASFTKKGPGRRPGHVNKLVRPAFDAAIQAVKLAQDDKESGGVGLAWLHMGRKAWAVWHDDIIRIRDGMLTKTTRWRAGVRGAADRMGPYDTARASDLY